MIEPTTHLLNTIRHFAHLIWQEFISIATKAQLPQIVAPTHKQSPLRVNEPRVIAPSTQALDLWLVVLVKVDHFRRKLYRFPLADATAELAIFI